MIEAAMKAMREEERANQNLELGFDDDVYDLACLTIAAIEPFIEGALKDRIEALTAENERLASVATDFASSLIVAENNLSHVSEENERLREALRVYAGPLEWEQEGGWGVFPVWADGYPGGVYIDDNTWDFGDAARAALEKQP
jgi:hypothetical protein